MAKDESIVQQIRGAAESDDPARIFRLWRQRDRAAWAGCIDCYRALAEIALNRGEPLLAYDVCVEGLDQLHDDVRLRQLQGLALARSGSSEAAQEILRRLHDQGHTDEETVGILARTYKDLADRATGSAAEREASRRRAAELYSEVHGRTGKPWSGINVATLKLLLGEKQEAIDLARSVRLTCQAELDNSDGDRYWAVATIAEAALVMGDTDEAWERYAEAGHLAREKKDFGRIGTTKRQALMLARHLGLDCSDLDEALPSPRVVVFAGHMIDRPERAVARFPSDLEHAVYRAIREHLTDIGVDVGFASAACGSDILFLEAVRELGGSTRVVLPYPPPEFVEDSVAIADDQAWVERFDQACTTSARVVKTSKHKVEFGSVSYDYAVRVLSGMASIHASRVDGELVCLAVWDQKPGDGPGGTATIVGQWRTAGNDVRVIDVGALAKKGPIEVGSSTDVSTLQPDQNPVRSGASNEAAIKAFLFADAVRFRRLVDSQMPRFVGVFMEAIAKLKTPGCPENIETWGDGLYAVFATPADAGRFALELAKIIDRTNWEEHGLPSDLVVRTAVHAGPVYVCPNPITGGTCYMGTHVNHAARIEPVTPPGQVYATEAFAALLAMDRIDDLTTTYVGRVTLAKEAGVVPLYRLHRSVER